MVEATVDDVQFQRGKGDYRLADDLKSSHFCQAVEASKRRTIEASNRYNCKFQQVIIICIAKANELEFDFR